MLGIGVLRYRAWRRTSSGIVVVSTHSRSGKHPAFPSISAQCMSTSVAVADNNLSKTSDHWNSQLHPTSLIRTDFEKISNLLWFNRRRNSVFNMSTVDRHTSVAGRCEIRPNDPGVNAPQNLVNVTAIGLNFYQLQ